MILEVYNFSSALSPRTKTAQTRPRVLRQVRGIVNRLLVDTERSCSVALMYFLPSGHYILSITSVAIAIRGPFTLRGSLADAL